MLLKEAYLTIEDTGANIEDDIKVSMGHWLAKACHLLVADRRAYPEHENPMGSIREAGVDAAEVNALEQWSRAEAEKNYSSVEMSSLATDTMDTVSGLVTQEEDMKEFDDSDDVTLEQLRTSFDQYKAMVIRLEKERADAVTQRQIDRKKLWRQMAALAAEKKWVELWTQQVQCLTVHISRTDAAAVLSLLKLEQVPSNAAAVERGLIRVLCRRTRRQILLLCWQYLALQPKSLVRSLAYVPCSFKNTTYIQTPFSLLDMIMALVIQNSFEIRHKRCESVSNVILF